MAYPKLIPDGLLEVSFADKKEADLFLIEVETYPEQDTLRQIRRDLAMVLLTHDVLADMLVVILSPKGDLTISAEQLLKSANGLTEAHLKVAVLEVWTITAEQLLALNDPYLLPLLLLTQYRGPSEELLNLCMQRITQEVPAKEQENILGVTYAFAGLKYNKEQLLDLLKGLKMALTFENALRKTPAVQELLAELEVKLNEEHKRELAEKEQETTRQHILHVLGKRLGTIPEDVANQLTRVTDQHRLNNLLDVALECGNVDAFRAAMVKP